MHLWRLDVSAPFRNKGWQKEPYFWTGNNAMQRNSPPFRADHVGSLLRSTALKQARGARERGEIDAGTLEETEDSEIEKLIRRQEEVGLRAVTDGENRRASWQTDFLVALDGVESYYGERKFKFQGPQPRPILLRLKDRLGGFSGHPMIEHFRFVAAHTRAMPKMTIPSPSSLHFRYGGDLSGPGGFLSRPRQHLSQDRARLRGCRLPLSPA
jgi:5-methyltetrahydropteroyltriglutamate--homocysteine methyltransferase